MLSLGHVRVSSNCFLVVLRTFISLLVCFINYKFNFIVILKLNIYKNITYMMKFNGYWGLGIGDWGLAQSPIPNPQSPIPNPQNTRYLTILKIKYYLLLYLI